MATFVFGPGFQSADSLLLLAMICLVFAFSQALEFRDKSEPARRWRRFEAWFPMAAERFDARYRGYNPALAAMVILDRAQRAERELRAYRLQSYQAQQGVKRTGERSESCEKASSL